MLIKNCISCQKEYCVKPYRAKKSKFCSRICQNSKQYKHYKIICRNCKKIFKVSASRINTKSCSLECKLDAQKSIKTLKDRRREHKFQQAARRNGRNHSRGIRRFVFKYKQKKCEICNYDEYDFCLDIHHANMNGNDHSLINLRVICVICHRKIHKGIIKLKELPILIKR